MKFGPIAGLLMIVHAPGVIAQAAIGGTAAGNATYRCVDGTGRSTYTNVQEEMGGKKCTLVSREVSVVPGRTTPVPPPVPARASDARPSDARPSDVRPATRIDPKTQRSRDVDRRRILEDELRNAEKALADARQKLAAQEAVRSGDEKNYQRVLDRLKPFQDEVRGAEDNVASIRRELGNLR